MEPEGAGSGLVRTRLREASSDDVAEIARIDALSRSEAWSEASYAQAFESTAQRCWVVERVDNQRVMGFLVAMLVADQGAVEVICVAPDCRRCGVASSLLQKLHRAARAESVASIFLEVRASNKAAKSLYESFGYKRMGARAGYFSDGEDADCLRLDFDES